MNDHDRHQAVHQPDDRPHDDASTRQLVQQSIMRHGPSTAAQLAERLRLTPAGVRRHLTQLTESGRVQPREQRLQGTRGRGRPAKAFALTDVGRAEFHQAYDDLAIAALSQLAQEGGDSALEEVSRARIRTVAERYRRLSAAQPERGAAEVLAEALSDDGYMASTQPARHGVQICQHHCPVAHVAEEFPQLCNAETEMFSELLGVHVQRLATIAHGDGVCTTHVPHQSLPNPTVRADLSHRTAAAPDHTASPTNPETTEA